MRVHVPNTRLSKSFGKLILLVLIAGCASPGVNGSKPRAGNGYVDFYAAPAQNVCWDVARFNPDSQQFESIYWKMKVPSSGVLRLAFKPGRHRLRINFLDVPVETPADIELEVRDSKVTPVQVATEVAGEAVAQTREMGFGGSVKGPAGRRVRTGTNETLMYRISASAEAPAEYRPKEQTSYAH